MRDNWAFVFAAYGFAAVLLGGYWRRLVRLEREITAAASRRRERPGSPSRGHGDSALGGAVTHR